MPFVAFLPIFPNFVSILLESFIILSNVLMLFLAVSITFEKSLSVITLTPYGAILFVVKIYAHFLQISLTFFKIFGIILLEKKIDKQELSEEEKKEIEKLMEGFKWKKKKI